MPVGPKWQRQPQIMNGIFFSRNIIDLIQKTGISVAEKSTLMKIMINKHIVMFVLYI